MSTYWTQFPGFIPNPNATFSHEFALLTQHQGWSDKGKKQLHRRAAALEAEFEHWYGTDATKLEKWQMLCEEVGINPVPGSINQCKKALKKVRVNLYDLVDARRTGSQVLVFSSHAAFVRYTKNGRVFPRALAKKEGFISALLRVVY